MYMPPELKARIKKISQDEYSSMVRTMERAIAFYGVLTEQERVSLSARVCTKSLSQTIKATWTMPTRECCGIAMRPVAHDTGDGWWLGLVCNNCQSDNDKIDWPFTKDSVYALDLRAAGFGIE